LVLTTKYTTLIAKITGYSHKYGCFFIVSFLEQNELSVNKTQIVTNDKHAFKIAAAKISKYM